MGAGDIDNDAVGIEFLDEKGDADDERGTMQLLRRPEHVAAKRMRDHDLIADFNCVHGAPFPAYQAPAL